MKICVSGVAVGIAAIAVGGAWFGRNRFNDNATGPSIIRIDQWDFLYPVREINRIGVPIKACAASDMRVYIGQNNFFYEVASIDHYKMEELYRSGHLLSMRTLCLDWSYVNSI